MTRWIGPAATDAGSATFRFAGERCERPLKIELLLESDKTSSAPKLALEGAPPGAKVATAPAGGEGLFLVRILVPPGRGSEGDDEVPITLRGGDRSALPSCSVILRRCGTRIGTALIERHRSDVPLRDQARAALLWHGWRRYSELLGLKRFTSGKSGSDVLVFRPRLHHPEGTPLPGVLDGTWGSPLLVKTGPVSDLEEEWRNFELYLRDRLHPFMARSERFLTVGLARVLEAGDGEREEPLSDPSVHQHGAATVLGSFLGGDFLRAEPFEELVRGAVEIDRLTEILDQLFAVNATWYEAAAIKKLRDWPRKLALSGGETGGRLLLGGELDLTRQEDRKRLGSPLAWDVSFITREHLHHHWLGKGDTRDGLLYRLLDLDLRFSLIHGDLHTRNILADEDNVWLLDFGHVGVGPTLFDFTKLEVYLRLWCLHLGPPGRRFEEAAIRFESHLLDHLTGSEATLEPLRTLAPELGADPDELFEIGHCICSIRRNALRYTLGSPDRRDYLAVLFLTALDALRYAVHEPELLQNHRLVVALAWTLEDVLSRIVGLEPYPRNRISLDPIFLVTPAWIRDRRLPGRIVYLMDSGSDAEALGPLAATRGVIQNDNHHLDVFDHTLSVLGYVEGLLENPLEGFLDPQGLEDRVLEDLERQGILLPPIAESQRLNRKVDSSLGGSLLKEIRALWRERLDEDAHIVLKTAAMLHDVGKPATRGVTVSKGKRNVQFLGHEVFGLRLARQQLESLFAERTDLRLRVEELIGGHHDHHNLVERYSRNPERLGELQRAVATSEISSGEWKYLARYLDAEVSSAAADFPMLLLHGFADVLSCRGPANATDIIQVAELDLLLLALFYRLPKIKERMILKEKCAALTKGLNQEIGVDGKRLGAILQQLRLWCLEQLARRQASGGKELTRDEVVAKAKSLAEG